MGRIRVKHGHKCTYKLSQEELEYNAKFSKIRYIVESTISNIKKWQILRMIYRADIAAHYDIFLCRCLLTEIMHLDTEEYFFLKI
jgi:hypothetical protein